MTCREKLKIEHPDLVGDRYRGGCSLCPSTYGYLDSPDWCDNGKKNKTCAECWDREIPEPKPIKTSMYDQIAAELKVMYDSYIYAGFDKEQATQFVNTILINTRFPETKKVDRFDSDRYRRVLEQIRKRREEGNDTNVK